MASKLSDSATSAWARLIRAQQALLERVEAELKNATLPPLAWYDVLLELNREPAGALRQFELGDKLLLNKHNLSRLLDRLQREALVKRRRCKEDGRGAEVAITAAGRALQKKMWPVYERTIDQYFARHLSARETEQLAELMARLIDKRAVA